MLDLHWHTTVKLFNGLVVYSDGNLCVGIKGKLNIVAAVAFPNFLSRKLHVFTTPEVKISNFTRWPVKILAKLFHNSNTQKDT